MRPSVTMSGIVVVRRFRSRHMCYIAGHVAWLSRTQATTTTITMMRVESLSFAGVLSVALTGMAARRGVQAAVAVCACECGSAGEGCANCVTGEHSQLCALEEGVGGGDGRRRTHAIPEQVGRAPAAKVW